MKAETLSCSHCGKKKPRSEFAYKEPAACFDCVETWKRPACPSCCAPGASQHGGWGPKLVLTPAWRAFYEEGGVAALPLKEPAPGEPKGPRWQECKVCDGKYDLETLTRRFLAEMERRELRKDGQDGG